MAEHGPSEAAVEAVAFALFRGMYESDERATAVAREHWKTAPDGGQGWRARARDYLAAAHNPALGLDRSVCLRDVVRLLDDNAAVSATKEAEYFNRKLADVIVRAFTESSSPDREGA